MTPIISIHPSDVRMSARLREACANAGLELSYAPSGRQVALSDATCISSGGVPPATVMQLADRIQQQTLGIPVIPSVIPRAAEDFNAFGDVQLFVKTRITLYKTKAPLMYTHWDSPAALAAAVGPDFWAYQASGQAELIIQPSAGELIDGYTCEFSVNEDSVPYIFNRVLYKAQRGKVDMERAVAPVTLPPGVENGIAAVCASLSITGGLHNAQFVVRDGVTELVEWTPRPIVSSVDGLFGMPGALEAALQHMVGIPVIPPPLFFMEQRLYKIANFSSAQHAFATANGIRLREFSGTPRCAFFSASTEQEVKDTLDAFDGVA